MSLSGRRHEYRLSLVSAPKARGRCPVAVSESTVDARATHSLAVLMLESFRGTVDYEGETLRQAVQEVESFFSPLAKNPALPECSVLLTSGATAVCASLVKDWRHRACPLIGYIMCHPEWKQLGLATFALAESLRILQLSGFGEVRAVITEGNVASEKLFLRAGFTRLLPGE